MARQDEVTLIVAFASSDAAGYPEEKLMETTVLALTQSAVRSEFYAAAGAGTRAEIEFHIWVADWEDAAKRDNKGMVIYPSRVVYAGLDFDITRDFTKNGVRQTIYCRRRM